MRKSRNRRNREKAQSHKNSLLYWGIIGGFLLVVLAFFLLQSQAPAGTTTSTGERSVWQTIPLTDARTGATFTLADFGERHVFVKIMSPTWGFCLQMQRSLRSAIPVLGIDDYVYVSIAVDPNLRSESLVTYADQQGFDWTFVVANEDFVRAFIGEFGRAAITTPNMVHFVIQPNGVVTQSFQGTPSPEQLVAEIRSVTG